MRILGEKNSFKIYTAFLLVQSTFTRRLIKFNIVVYVATIKPQNYDDQMMMIMILQILTPTIHIVVGLMPKPLPLSRELAAGSRSCGFPTFTLFQARWCSFVLNLARAQL